MSATAAAPSMAEDFCRYLSEFRANSINRIGSHLIGKNRSPKSCNAGSSPVYRSTGANQRLGFPRFGGQSGVEVQGLILIFGSSSSYSLISMSSPQISLTRSGRRTTPTPCGTPFKLHRRNITYRRVSTSCIIPRIDPTENGRARLLSSHEAISI